MTIATDDPVTIIKNVGEDYHVCINADGSEYHVRDAGSGNTIVFPTVRSRMIEKADDVAGLRDTALIGSPRAPGRA